MLLASITYLQNGVVYHIDVHEEQIVMARVDDEQRTFNRMMYPQVYDDANEMWHIDGLIYMAIEYNRF